MASSRHLPLAPLFRLKGWGCLRPGIYASKSSHSCLMYVTGNHAYV